MLAPVRPALQDLATPEFIDDFGQARPEDDGVMLGYLASMKEFLGTQSEIMQAYLTGSSGSSPGRPADNPRPGPWLGTPAMGSGTKAL